jgi:hypothetical protein
MVPKPQILLQWEEWAKLGRPRCCHTCRSYDAAGSGWCSYYDHSPPVEFVQLADSCPAHKQDVPF